MTWCWNFRIHVYNIEELILCSLPYHDTHAFVRIVQLIDTGFANYKSYYFFVFKYLFSLVNNLTFFPLLSCRNSKWKFLDGVKVSGAPPPRKVIVQQCLRDKGVLEVLCNYVSFFVVDLVVVLLTVLRFITDNPFYIGISIKEIFAFKACDQLMHSSDC